MRNTYTAVNNTTEALATETDVSFVNTDATDVTQIDVFGCINNSHMAMIDNLVIVAE